MNGSSPKSKSVMIFRMVAMSALFLTINLSVLAGCSKEEGIVDGIPGDIDKELDYGTPGDLVFTGIFNNSFNSPGWRKSWGVPWSGRTSECEILQEGFEGGATLRVKYPEGAVGPGEGGTQFPIVFAGQDSIAEHFYNELYFRYYLKFEDGFDFRLGGKLPGLMGGGNSWSRSGGNQPDGTNGWTLRFMWNRNGRITVYAYVPPSENGKWGSEKWGQSIDCNFLAEAGKWHLIEQFVNTGTPGKDDGKLIIWIDGKKRLEIDDMRFRDVDNDFGKIGGIYFSTFHGGNTADWGPLHDSFVQFSNLVVYKKRE